MAKKTVIIFCALMLAFGVQAFTLSFCETSGISLSENTEHATADHACCISSGYAHDTDLNACEECRSCTACASQQSSPNSRGQFSRFVELMAHYRISTLVHRYSDILIVNNKQIIDDLAMGFTLPPSTPVLLI